MRGGIGEVAAAGGGQYSLIADLCRLTFDHPCTGSRSTVHPYFIEDGYLVPSRFCQNYNSPCRDLPLSVS